MSPVEIKALPRSDGFYLRVDGIGAPFRFRLGVGDVARTDHQSHFLWSVQNSPVGGYLVQFIPHGIAAEPGSDAMNSLAAHFRWEVDFLRDRLGIFVDENRAGFAYHVSGAPILAWLNVNPKATAEAGVTPYAAQVTLLHETSFLLHFSVTGFGDDWCEEDLAAQARRIAFSYFPLE
ncbi:hypothetical protein [Bradyrhizobium sp. MOS003]|uniref:hypothetical protein n=1 Tax=Bradyrhizobium sp. MOS003 TaxID=2133946 RepID=UPI0011BE638F|nr:hypothetical protein [Bradyrhizobium sp. MOS003]